MREVPKPGDKLIDECRRFFAAGDEYENVIAHLKNNGVSKLQTMRVFCELANISIDEAKRIVHLSQAWKSAYEKDEKLRAVLEKYAVEDGGAEGF